jgi:exopolysaccharide production protein ExoQ
LYLAAGAVLVSLVQLYVLYEARSAGAILGFGLAVAVFVFLLALRSEGVAVRAAVISFLVLCLLSASLSYRFLSNALIDAGARFFDKDPTLTGRTYLWQRASELIAETPGLGRGFASFWQQGNPDAEGLWQFAGIGSRGGFNFHNTAIEVLVHLGWFGLVICSIVMIIAAGFLVARFLARPNLFHCFWLSILTYEMVRMPIESIGINEFYFSTVLLFMALGSAFARPAARRSAVLYQSGMRPMARARAAA